MIEPLRIFIGFDGKEAVAYHTLAHSILRRATVPVTIAPLVQQTLREIGVYTRERGPTESTEFSMTRFLVPYLSGYYGRSIFLDCDILCRCDIRELDREWVRGVIRANRAGNPEPAVMVCQHDYQPSETVKFLGQPQTAYPRKNWSSVMLFDNDQCRMLTPAYVNAATGLELHRFQWLKDQNLGALPLPWNWLVGEYAPIAEAKLVHFTAGGPWHPGYETVDYADEWRAERDLMLGRAEVAA